MLYNAALRAELTRRLGVAFGPVNDKAQAEVLGVPPGLITRTPATPVEVLAAALARSGVEPAATQVVRDQLARSEDLAVLYPMLEQARVAVDALAGPDRSADVAVLRRQAAPLEAVEAQLRAAVAWLAGVETEPATVAARIDDLSPAARAGHEDRWWRRPRREVVRAAGADSTRSLCAGTNSPTSGTRRSCGLGRSTATR